MLTVPGVKALSGPVATACRPWRMVSPEREFVNWTEPLRRPGRVGVKWRKIWQVLGIAPAAAGLSEPVQVLLVMLKSGPEAAERLTFSLTTKVMGVVVLWLPTGVAGKMHFLRRRISSKTMKLQGLEYFLSY
jgi:hypothetical protein